MTYKHAPYYLSCKLSSWKSQLFQTIKKLHEGLQKNKNFIIPVLIPCWCIRAPSATRTPTPAVGHENPLRSELPRWRLATIRTLCDANSHAGGWPPPRCSAAGPPALLIPATSFPADSSDAFHRGFQRRLSPLTPATPFTADSSEVFPR